MNLSILFWLARTMLVRHGRTRSPGSAGGRAYLAGFIFLGLASTFTGPALSYLRDRAGTDDAGIGLVFVGSSIGYVIGSLLSGRIVDRGGGHRWWSAGDRRRARGHRRDLGADARSASIVAVFAVLGFMLAGCDTAGNTLVLWARPDDSGPLLHGLHLCFAIGALLAPLVVNRALAWTDSLWPLLVPLGVIGAYCVLAVPHPAGAGAHAHRARPPTPARRRPAPDSSSPCALFFVVYVGVETGVAGWVHSYVEQIGYGGAGTATGVTAIFWTGFVCGRLLAIPLSRRIRPARCSPESLGLLIVDVGRCSSSSPGRASGCGS